MAGGRDDRSFPRRRIRAEVPEKKRTPVHFTAKYKLRVLELKRISLYDSRVNWALCCAVKEPLFI